ncbi:MAG: type II toxin-antitoxin system HicB family antitoxin [Ignavibacteriae bacterium]|nr:type II toxin-antitoxin system HicB family antitoxin [Ignavibacteriota bacterium]
MQYKVVITYDTEYKGYVVDVPQLFGCMSQGKTLDEAIENTKDAIQAWLEVENSLGRVHENVESQMFMGEVEV